MPVLLFVSWLFPVRYPVHVQCNIRCLVRCMSAVCRLFVRCDFLRDFSCDFQLDLPPEVRERRILTDFVDYHWFVGRKKARAATHGPAPTDQSVVIKNGSFSCCVRFVQTSGSTMIFPTIGCPKNLSCGLPSHYFAEGSATKRARCSTAGSNEMVRAVHASACYCPHSKRAVKTHCARMGGSTVGLASGRTRAARCDRWVVRRSHVRRCYV